MRLRLALAAAAVSLALVAGGAPAGAAPGDTVFALTASNTIVSFAPGSPGTTSTPVAITGLNTGESLVGIDFRPANNTLYGLGSSSQLYTINPSTGVATKVGGPFTPALAGTQWGFDFNPTVDRIRVVSDSGQNFRLHPDTGAVVATDMPLVYKAGDVNAANAKAVVAAGYTNPDNDPATGTVLFDIDSTNATLARQDPPNDGTLNTVGSLGAIANRAVAFDIGPVAGALLVTRPMSGGSRLYRVDLTTGATTDAGAIGAGLEITGIAIKLEAAPAPAPAPTPTPTASATATPSATVSPTATPTRTAVAPGPPATGQGQAPSGSTPWLGMGLGLLIAMGGIATIAAASRRGATQR